MTYPLYSSTYYLPGFVVTWAGIYLTIYCTVGHPYFDAFLFVPVNKLISLAQKRRRSSQFATYNSAASPIKGTSTL